MIADGQDGRFDEFSLIEAALIAEGIESEQRLRHLVKRFGRWETELQVRVADVAGAQRRAAVVHNFMHERILTGKYSVGCNQVSRSIQAGEYNCVTATLVALALGRSCDLPLRAVQVPGHVRARLPGEVPLEIETTCPQWLPPEVRQTATPVQILALPKTRCSENTVRGLSDAALVAKIYYNRGIALLDAQRFAHAVAVTRAALVLDPEDEPTRKNLLAAYNNWALSLCENGEFADAADITVYALGMGADYEPLAANDLHIHQQWVLHLCDAGKFAEALSILENGYQRRPEAELFDRGRDAVRRWWAESLEPVPVGNIEMD